MMKLPLTLLAALLLIFHATSAEAERPNILWLVAEDSNVNWIGCYGNPEAKTPNIDAFAKTGFRYTHAYASAPVCAAQRSTWITGINSISMGTHPMRSRYAIPHDLSNTTRTICVRPVTSPRIIPRRTITSEDARTANAGTATRRTPGN